MLVRMSMVASSQAFGRVIGVWDLGGTLNTVKQAKECIYNELSMQVAIRNRQLS